MQNKVDNVNNKLSDAHGIFEELHHLMHVSRAQQFRMIREQALDVTHMEYKALGFFSRHPQATLSDLVSHSGRDKAQLARLITELRKKGLLNAEPDAHDKRSTRLSLSASGANIINGLQEAERALSAQAVQGLSGEEYQQLVSLLKKVGRNLDKSQGG
jgi:DNA-binding MarR family transcriptional regulator